MQPGIARSDRYLALLRDVGRVLARAPSEHDALTAILEAICSRLGYQYGACWKQDEQTRNVTCTQIWHEPALAASAFVAYQGYYFSVPLPANAFAELVRRQAQRKQDSGRGTQDSVEK